MHVKAEAAGKLALKERSNASPDASRVELPSLSSHLLRAALLAITIPLLFGGVIAAGESGDGMVLLCGAISASVLGVSLFARSTVQPTD
jgi:hypothetical protein